MNHYEPRPTGTLRASPPSHYDTAARPGPGPGPGPGRKFVAKGHDSQLQDAQYSGCETTITMISGATFTGTVLRRDKFTITLRHSGGDEIFYKHAIEGVLIAPAATSSLAG